MAVVMLDYSAVCLVYTAILFLFLDNQQDFVYAYSLEWRFVMLGCLFAVTSLGQFIAAPILGRFSDQWGRRRGLLLTSTGTLLGILLSGLAISLGSLTLLFVSRLVTGLFAGNLSIAQASFSDISSDQMRTVNFNLLEMSIGAGLVIGPYMINPAIISWFWYSTPFYFLAIINILLILMLLVFFSETVTDSKLRTYAFQRSMNQVREENRLKWNIGFHHIFQAFQLTSLRGLFMVWAIFALGFSFYWQFFTTFLKAKAHFSNVAVGHLFLILGVVYIIFQMVIAFPIVRHIRAERLIKPTLLAVGIFILLLGLSKTHWQVYLFRICYMAFFVVFMPSFNAVVGNEAPPSHAGEVFGILSSIYAFASIPIAIIGGIISAYAVVMPITISGVLILLSWLVLVVKYHPKKTNVTESPAH